MIWLILTGKQIIDKYSKDEMSVYAAQASFFIILAAIPFLMVLLALIQLIPMVHEADLVTVLVQAVPDNLTGLVLSVIADLYSGSPIALASFSAAAALWSSSKGMLSIERGLNRVYGITVRRGYLLQRLYDPFYPDVRRLSGAFSLWRYAPGSAFPMDSRPFPFFLSGGPSKDRPLSWTDAPLFPGGLYGSSLPEAENPASASGRRFLHRRMDAVFHGLFHLFRVFWKLYHRVRQLNGRHPDDAVALFLHLHPLSRRGTKLALCVLPAKGKFK